MLDRARPNGVEAEIPGVKEPMTIRKTAAMALLLLAGHAHAEIKDIEVTTTVDEDKDDQLCSLREAITLINRQLASTTAGYHGCGGLTNSQDSYTQRIILKSGEVYTLTQGSIAITQSMTLASDQTALLPINAEKENPIITTSAVQRLFVIDDGSSALEENKSVSFDQVDLKGCGASHPDVSSCTQDPQGNGGILINNETLSFVKSRISDGRAINGGALYMPTVKQGRISLSEVILQDNRAQQGGALWVASTNFSLSRSLVRKNTSSQTLSATQEPGAAIFVLAAPDTALVAPAQVIWNSTLTENTGYAVILKAGMAINSSTIVNNIGGVYIKSNNPATTNGKPINWATLSNSLLAGNGTLQDCRFDATEGALGSASYLNHLVFMGGCDQHPLVIDNTRNLTNLTSLATATSDPERKLDLTTLFADANGDGKCDLPPARGLLCPLEKRRGEFVDYYRPRLLISYQSLQDSPIVNKGNSTPNAYSRFLGCTNSDQRDKARVLCDIGAIELKVAETDSNSKNNFADLLYGQIAHIDLSGRVTENRSEDVLGDGELIPASECSKIYPNATVPAGGWLNGCVRYITPPSKGSMVIDNQNNELVYTPSGNWHGEDRFSYYLTTTTTRFSDAVNDQSIEVYTKVSQAPDTVFPSYKANMGSGATGWAGLLGLMGLAWLRRRSLGKGV